MAAELPDLNPANASARLASAVSSVTKDAGSIARVPALDIPRVPLKFSALHLRIRSLLDPEMELITENEIHDIVRRIGVIPHRAIGRCLMLMGMRARGDPELLLKVRQLDAMFRNGLIAMLAEKVPFGE